MTKMINLPFPHFSVFLQTEKLLELTAMN